MNAVGIDKATILASASRALDGCPPSPGDVDALILLLRGHINLLIPEIEALARLLPGGEQGRCLALASVGEARRKLRACWGPGGPERRAEQLARVCRALIFHFEELEAARVRTLST
ncbi:DUF6415 family natural product biosynthesis protein [Streptomyces sp. NPDC000410]|uniref:DUF6415 family natural product biosynthesis protein n=1 Tax=Streptomyces sp. NPDC000410 TaxID=3154254 RepID=UPI003322D944